MLVGLWYLVSSTYSPLCSSTDDYRAHTTCMTEVERYELKGKKAPNQKQKKQTPQEAWMELLVQSIDAAPNHLQHKLSSIASLSNVPRKEKQFRNFCANSLNLRGNRQGETEVAEIWDYLKQLRENQMEERKQAEEAAKQEKEIQEAATKTEVDETKPQPVEDGSSDEEKSVDSAKHSGKKEDPLPDSNSVKKAMKKVLKKAPGKSLSVKKLRKEVRTYLKLPKTARQRLKDLVGKNCSGKFAVDGKNVSLKD